MEEGLWQINPNLIKNLRYYVSLMPNAYRRELLEYTYIPTPMGGDFQYDEWKDYNFDGRYNLKKKPSWDIYDEENLPPFDDDINTYYFLLFFFSAFKRSPVDVEGWQVVEWMGRCLIDVWKEDPSITPYASKLRGSNLWPKDVSEMGYGDGLWDDNLVDRDLLSDAEGIINPNAILNARDYDNLGLSESRQSGLYQLFISPVFDLLGKGNIPFDAYMKYPAQHFIRTSMIDKEAYMENAKEMFFKTPGLWRMNETTYKRSYNKFQEYWSQYNYLIPIGFLSRNEDSLRFMNYSLKSFENLK